MTNLKHGKEELIITLAKYGNGTPAVQLLDKDGSPYIMLSTNLDSPLQNETHIFIKDYDTHSEIAESMEALGLLILTDKKGQSGFNNYKLYELTDLLFQNSEKL